MGLGRRKIGIHDESAWVFNRMVRAYAARPPYPDALIDALVLRAAPPLPVLDLGAGLGHVALPLAARGLRVVAIEPARVMCEALAERAEGLSISAVHAAAEELPVADRSIGLALIDDALHFFDAHRLGSELARVLAPGATFACIFVELASTPFMMALKSLMERSAPRRPRAVLPALQQVATVAGVVLEAPCTFDDHTALDEAALLGVLQSISFIGPAMNPARSAAFQERVLALPKPRVWSRKFTLYLGTLAGSTGKRRAPEPAATPA